MRHLFPLSISLLVLFALGACAKRGEEAAALAGAPPGASGNADRVAGQSNRPGSFLAYEHEVTIRMAGSRIATRVATVRAACMDERFGACTVLAEEQGAGEAPHGRLQLRAAPVAVDKLVALAAGGAEIAQRSTHAEDLADAVRDNGLRQRRLELQHAKLVELAERRDAKLEDLLSINQQLSELEAELQQAGQEAAQQRRRIDTNLLTLDFQSLGVTAETSETRRAFRGLGRVWDNSMAVLVTLVGALLPFAALAGLIWAGVSALRRWRRHPPKP
jgi:hypothetical protein